MPCHADRHGQQRRFPLGSSYVFRTISMSATWICKSSLARASVKDFRQNEKKHASAKEKAMTAYFISTGFFLTMIIYRNFPLGNE
jgi:uncharacterized membrane protein YbaN (DUF454 family)